MKSKVKAELLSPAGDLQRLKTAVLYGADAVYCAGRQFGLRAAAPNFSDAELDEGVRFAHERGKKVYAALNAYLRDEELPALARSAAFLREIGADAVIVSDPGVLVTVREAAPGLPVHLSTQANCISAKGALFWHRQGISRVILARELSIGQAEFMRRHLPESLELEAFVHGAMCMAYSGRCHISRYLAGRDANAGDCAQPCRWRYALCEEKRPGRYYPVEEDQGHTYFFYSKDLCLIEHLPALINAGVASFKIEGRNKTAHYLASVTRAYRMAIDALDEGRFDEVLPAAINELKQSATREFTDGFAFGHPPDEATQLEPSARVPRKLAGWAVEGGASPVIRLRQPVNRSDVLTAMLPEGGDAAVPLDSMRSPDGSALFRALPERLIVVDAPVQIRADTVFRL